MFSYIVGSLNSAIIATFFVSGKDIRDYGSKNAGLTNVYRCFGKTAAVLTIVFDLLKGFLVILSARLPFMVGLLDKSEYDVLTVCGVATLFAIVGHSYPVFYGFKGGKGILIAGVCMLLTDPVVFGCEFIVFVATVAASRYISLGSILCCIGYPLFTFAWQMLAVSVFNLEYKNILVHTLFALLAGIFCLLRHMPNVKRLIKGEENRFAIRKD